MRRSPYTLKRSVRCGNSPVDALILSTYDTDGAGKFALQQMNALQKLGYSTQVICVRSRSGDACARGIIDGRPFQQITYRLVSEIDRRLFRPSPEHAFIHLHDLPDRTVLKSDVWPDECKLIICTFLSGMMSPSALLKIRERYGNPPVVFYGVDMNLYTGGCHYSRDCTAYQDDCSKCPAVPRLLHARVKRAFAKKYKCYREMQDHAVIACSHQHQEQIQSSQLFRESDMRRILMHVSSDLYGKHESSRIALKKDYGFAKNVVLIRSSSEPRKGCDLFIESIRSLHAESPEILRDMTIVAIGDQYISDQLHDLDVDICSPGYISDDDQLSRLYSVADIFINPSLADSGPVMLAQSLMSGTPVITTEVGLATDLVVPLINGYVLNEASAENIKRGLVWFCQKSDDEQYEMRGKARSRAMMQLSESSYLKSLSSLANELIARSE